MGFFKIFSRRNNAGGRRMTENTRTYTDEIPRTVYKLKKQRSYFKRLITLPFLIQWQILMVFTVTYHCVFRLYYILFNRTFSRFPHIKPVNVTNVFSISLIVFCDMVYLTDTLTLAIHKFSPRRRSIHPYKEVSLFYVFLSLAMIGISIYDYTLPMLGVTSGSVMYIEYIQALIVLRVTRLIICYKYILNSIYLNIKVISLIYLATIIKIFAISGALFVAIEWVKSPWEYGKTAEETLMYLVPMLNDLTLSTWPIKTNMDLFLRGVYISCNSLLSRGQVPYGADSILKSIMYQLIMFSSMLFQILLVCMFTIIIIYGQLKNVQFNSVIEELRRKLISIEVTNSTRIAVNDWYDTLWRARDATVKTKIKELLPSGLYQDCCLDTYWPAFKHGNIFKDMDNNILTALSLNMETQFHCTGNVLYKSGMLQSTMYYLSHGTVNVMSRFDNVTPIITFTAGTCFGESTLLVSYPSRIKLVCASQCEILTLNRAGFIDALSRYPDEAKKLRLIISDRYTKAKTLYAMKQVKRAQDIYSMIGLHFEGTLKRIKRVSREIDRVVFLKSNEKFETEDRIHKITSLQKVQTEYIGTCSDYLYGLTFSQPTDDTDVSFVTTSCPLILHPISPFVKIWNVFIILMVFTMIILSEYEAGIETTLSPWQIGISVVIQSCFIIDIFLQCTIAIILEDRSYTTVHDIFFYRLQTLEYKADIIGSIPLNFLIVFYGAMHASLWGILKSPCLLRGWRFLKIAEQLTQRTFEFKKTITLLTYIFFFFMTVNTWSTIFNVITCFDGECDKHGMWVMIEGEQISRYDHFTVAIKSLAHTLLLTFGEGGRIVIPYTRNEHLATLIMSVYNFILNALFLAGITAIGILVKKSQKVNKDVIVKIISFINNYDISKSLRYRIFRHYKILRSESEYCFRGNEDLVGLSPELQKEIKITAWANYFLQVPFFKETEQKFLYDVVNVSCARIFPPNETVCYSGMSPIYTYILKQGYCQILSESGEVICDKGPGWSFCIMEVLLNIPVIVSIRTLTSCEFVYSTRRDLMHVLHEWPQFEHELNVTIDDCTRLLDIPVVDIGMTHFSAYNENPSFYNFGYNLVAGSKAEKEFLQPFHKIIPSFTIIRYALLRTVILPSGRAIWVMEIARSIFALCSCIVFPAKLVFITNSPYSISLFIFLDVCAFLDIYYRLHVAYYNQDGILVKHPLMTAIHYLKHSFIVDLVACLPFELMISHILPIPTAEYFLCFNRILQIHRPYGLLNYIYNSQINPSPKSVILKHSLILIIMINLFGSIVFHYSCTITENLQRDKVVYIADGIDCPDIQYNGIIFGTSMRPVKMYILFQLYMTAMITQVNLLTFGQWDKHRICTVIVSFIGYGILIYMMGQLVSLTFVEKTGITFQAKIKTLLQFFKQARVSQEITKEFVLYYNLLWEHHQGQNPKDTIEMLNFSLKTDILFNVYGRNLKECTIFSKTNVSFFRSFILPFNPEIYHKGSHILDAGFIHSDIYILHEGFITVLSGSRVMMTLGKGAIFGNLLEVSAVQQSVTIIAHTPVEVLKLSTVELYRLLDAYPHYKELLHTTIIQHLTKGLYVIPGIIDGVENIVTDSIRTPKKINYRLVSSKVQFTKAIISLLSSVVNIYVISVHEFTIPAFMIIILLDIFTVITIIINCYTPFESTVGEYVIDNKLIKEWYRSKSNGFFFDLFTIFPFETCAFFFARTIRAYCYLRFNRIFRFIQFTAFMTTHTKKIVDKQSKVRVLYIIFNFYCTIYVMACIFSLLYANNVINMEDIDIYSRFVLFFHGLNMKESIFARFPVQFVLPSKTHAIIICRLLEMIVAVIVKSIIIGHFLFFIESYMDDVLTYKETRHEIIKILKVQKVSAYLLQSVSRYLQFLWDKNSGVQVPDTLLQAPISLQCKLLNSLFNHHLSEHFIFSKCQSTFLDQLILHLQMEMILPGNIIVRLGTKDCNMYFVHKGEVHEYVTGKESEIRLLVENQYFGTEQGLNYKMSHTHSYKAYTNVIILKLHFHSWKYLLDHFPAEKNKIFRTLKETTNLKRITEVNIR